MKKVLFVTGVWLYIFFILGLIFHTSYGKQYIFDKYSYSYFLMIILSILAFFPYILFIRFFQRPSQFYYKKKKINLSSKHKLIILCVVLILLITSGEIYMREKNLYVRQTVYNMVFQPFLQNKMRPNLGAEFHIDSYGFRADAITIKKPKNTYRIAILGGSTAYEVNVSYNQSAPKLLQDMLNKHYSKKIQVINAGVSGYTSEHTLIDYQTRVSDFKPDLVIMWHGVNDMYASCADPNSITGPYQPDYTNYLGPIQNMVETYFFPPLFSIHFYTLDYAMNLIETHLYSDFDNLYNNLADGTIEYQRSKIPSGNMQFPSITSYKRNLRYITVAVLADNTKFIIGNQPNMFATDQKYHMTTDGIFCYNGKIKANMQSQIKGMAEFNAVTKEVANEYHIPFIDLNSAIPKTPEYFFDDVHWTPKGNEIAAKKLYNFIVAGNYISQ